MPYQDILYASANGVATITLNRPEKLNAFRSQTLGELTQALNAAIKDKAIGVIVITGAQAAKPSFCVGGDLAEMKTLTAQTCPGFMQRLLHLGRTLLNAPKPLLAKVDGYCLGGGNEIQLFCDLTIASDRSTFGQVGPKVGSIPLWGGTQILPRLVGMKRAKEMIFLCHPYSAAEALEMGLINRVVPTSDLDTTTQRVAQELLVMSPQALRLARQALHEGILKELERDLKKLQKIYGSAELHEGMSAFLEKRTADFARFR